MFSFTARFGVLAIAAALLFAAARVHKSSGKHSKISKPAGVVLAFFAGCAFLVTFFGSWMTSVPGTIAVAGLIAAVAIIAVDWGLDGRPDKPAFWAAFVLAGFLVVGVPNIPTATGQVGDGLTRVSNTVSNGR